VEKGADVAVKDKTIRTPLHWAIKNGHHAVVRLLQSTIHDLGEENDDEEDDDEEDETSDDDVTNHNNI
jgi:hypothetical protein